MGVFKIWRLLKRKKIISDHAKEKEEIDGDRDNLDFKIHFSEGAEMEEKTILKTMCNLPDTEK